MDRTGYFVEQHPEQAMTIITVEQQRALADQAAKERDLATEQDDDEAPGR